MLFDPARLSGRLLDRNNRYGFPGISNGTNPGDVVFGADGALYGTVGNDAGCGTGCGGVFSLTKLRSGGNWTPGSGRFLDPRPPRSATGESAPPAPALGRHAALDHRQSEIRSTLPWWGRRIRMPSGLRDPSHLEMMAATSGDRLSRISMISSSNRIALSSSVRRCWSFRSCAFGGGHERGVDMFSQQPPESSVRVLLYCLVVTLDLTEYKALYKPPIWGYRHNSFVGMGRDSVGFLPQSPLQSVSIPTIPPSPWRHPSRASRPKT